MERDGQKRREGSNVMILLALFFSLFSLRFRASGLEWVS